MLFGRKKEDPKIRQGWEDFREMLVGETINAVKVLRKLSIVDGSSTMVGANSELKTSYSRPICDDDIGADHLCQCVEKCLLFGLRTKSKSGDTWPMLSSLERHCKPKNSALLVQLGIARRAAVNWDRGRVLIRVLLNEKLLSSLFAWIISDENFLKRWYRPYCLMCSPRIQEIIGNLTQLSAVTFRLGIITKPRYTWSMTDGFPGISYIAPQSGKRRNANSRNAAGAANAAITSGKLGRIRGGAHNARGMQKSHSDNTISQYHRHQRAGGRRKPWYLGGILGSSSSSSRISTNSSSASRIHGGEDESPALDTDRAALEAVRNSGRIILLRDAERAVEKKVTYRAWLHEFSPRDACDPERGSRISSRAGITSAFAQAWIGAGGSFTDDERMSMELTPEEKRQQAMYLQTRRVQREHRGKNNNDQNGRRTSGGGGGGGKGAALGQIKKKMRPRQHVVRVVCHGRVYRINLDEKKQQPYDFVFMRLQQLLGNQVKHMRMFAVSQQHKEKEEEEEEEEDSHPATHSSSAAKGSASSSPKTAGVVATTTATTKSATTTNHFENKMQKKRQKHSEEEEEEEEQMEIRSNSELRRLLDESDHTSTTTTTTIQTIKLVVRKSREPPPTSSSPSAVQIETEKPVAIVADSRGESSSKLRLSSSAQVSSSSPTQRDPQPTLLPSTGPLRKNIQDIAVIREDYYGTAPQMPPEASRASLAPIDHRRFAYESMETLMTTSYKPPPSPAAPPPPPPIRVAATINNTAKTADPPQHMSTRFPPAESSYAFSPSLLGSSYLPSSRPPSLSLAVEGQVEVNVHTDFDSKLLSSGEPSVIDLEIQEEDPFGALQRKLADLYNLAPRFQISCELAYGEISITSSGILSRVVAKAAMNTDGRKSITITVSHPDRPILEEGGENEDEDEGEIVAKKEIEEENDQTDDNEEIGKEEDEEEEETEEKIEERGRLVEEGIIEQEEKEVELRKEMAKMYGEETEEEDEEEEEKEEEEETTAEEVEQEAEEEKKEDEEEEQKQKEELNVEVEARNLPSHPSSLPESS
eukprot:jgi/Bigna1/75867/fgenesh1_pg.37_\